MSSATAWGGRRAQRFTALVLREYGPQCHLCGRDGATTADHITPLVKGGHPFDLLNARPAHQACNSARRDLDLDEWFRRYPLRRTPALAPSRKW